MDGLGNGLLQPDEMSGTVVRRERALDSELLVGAGAGGRDPALGAVLGDRQQAQVTLFC